MAKLFLKGYRTYLAIVLTALVVGLHEIGVFPGEWFEWTVAALAAAGLYFRAKA